MSKASPKMFSGDWLKRYQWTYFLGWLLLAVVALLVKWFGPALFRHLDWLIDQLAPSASLGWKIVLVVVSLVLVPLAAGLVAQLLFRFFKGGRDVQALQQMQEKLYAELDSGGQRGYEVVLVDWPNPGVRSVALVTSRFEESATGRQLASIYLPGTPDPTSGALRIVPVEDLSPTDWTRQEFTRFHITFGSVSPKSV